MDLLSDDIDSLSDSWVDVKFQDINRPLSNSSTPPNSLNSSYERLFFDALHSSGSHSSKIESQSDRISFIGSLSPHSEFDEYTNHYMKHIRDQKNLNEWIWDWSSRPEIQSPSINCNLAVKLKHPLSCNSPIINENCDYNDDNKYPIPSFWSIIISHACTFLLGAAIAFFFIRRNQLNSEQLDFPF